MSDNVRICYLIEKFINFNPERCTLTNQLNMKEIKLKNTASLCFLLLLKNHNKVIMQHELLEFAWGDSHREVTFNTYYQIILSIRKALLDIGLEKQIVTTIVRKGLIIRDDISVEHITESVEPLLTGIPPYSDIDQCSECATVPRQELLIPEIIILIITLTMCIFLFIRYINSRDDNFFFGYVPLHPHTQGCQYFINADAHNASRHEDILRSHPEMCQEGNIVYITAYPETMSASVIMCKKPVTDDAPNTCISIFFPKQDK